MVHEPIEPITGKQTAGVVVPHDTGGDPPID